MKKIICITTAAISLLSASVSFADNVINTTVSTPLPAQMIVGQTYKVGFTLTNVTGQNVTLDRLYADPAQPLPQGLTVTTNTCTPLLVLAPQQSCYWVANYTPQNSTQTTQPIVLYMDRAPFSKHVLVGSTSGSATYPLVSAKVITAVPAQSIEGFSYPIRVAFTNESGAQVASIPLSPFMPTGVTHITNGCNNPVAAGATCIWQAEYIAPLANTTNNFSIGYASDNVKQTVQLPQTYTSQGGFQVEIARNFPATTYVGSRYSLEYKLTNYTASALTISSVSTTAQTGLVPWPTTASASASGVDTCSGQSIAAGASCNWGADFTIAEPTSYTVVPQLQLADTAEPEILPSISTTAVTTDVTSQIKFGTELKTPSLIGQSYTTSYLISNPTSEAITLLGFSGIDGEFSIASSGTCSSRAGSNVIAAGQSCQLDITYLPETLGYAEVAPIVSLALADKQQIDHVLQNQITKAVYPTVAVSIAGDKLPEKTVVNHSYQLEYLITNNSAAAQTITAINDVSNAVNNVTDNCTGQTLDPAGTCTWSADFSVAEAGTYVIQPSLKLAAGNSVVFPKQTSTAVSENLSVTITKLLPQTLTQNGTYSGVTVYKLTNNSGTALTISSLTSEWSPPTNFSWNTNVTNSCRDSIELKDDESCLLSGNYSPSELGTVTLSPAILINGIGAEALPVQTTTVSAGKINVKVVSAIPSSMSITAKKVYHVEYDFTNSVDNSTISAIKISGIPTQLDVTPTTSDQPCIGLGSGETCKYTFDVQLNASASPATLNYTVSGAITTEDTTSHILTDRKVTISKNTLQITS